MPPTLLQRTRQRLARIIGGAAAPVFVRKFAGARIDRLAAGWPRICIGSSGDYATVGNRPWWGRIAQAMRVVCDDDGRPMVRMHGLRMLDPEVFRHLPFSSSDSTNIGRNVGLDVHWRGTYTPPTKEARAAVMRSRIEASNAPPRWGFICPELEAQGSLI